MEYVGHKQRATQVLLPEGLAIHVGLKHNGAPWAAMRFLAMF
jgi:hypothetical protein